MRDTARRGFSIHIFLPDGVPDGLRVVEKSNWTGIGFVCPRARLSEAKKRGEFSRAGVYVLSGPLSGDDLPTVYIGEGDPVKPRLESHYAKRDFWTMVVVFTSKDATLNKAHVQHLESRLVGLAQEAKRCQLDNANTPQLPSLSESDTATIEAFLDEMLQIFPVLGLTIFEKPEAPPAEEHLLYLEARGVKAKGFEASQGFVVLKGSQAAGDTVPSIHNYLVTLRERLKEKGILVSQGEHLVMAQDYAFDSPSGAASAMLGRNTNGREAWKDANGATLKAIQSIATGESPDAEAD